MMGVVQGVGVHYEGAQSTARGENYSFATTHRMKT
jgi:hypothetical protein